MTGTRPLPPLTSTAVRPLCTAQQFRTYSQQLVQTSNLYRWNCNVFGWSRKMTGKQCDFLRGGYRRSLWVLRVPWSAPPRRSNFRTYPRGLIQHNLYRWDSLRFREVSKNDRGKLCAKFVWRWPDNPVAGLTNVRSSAPRPSCYPRALRASSVPWRSPCRRWGLCAAAFSSGKVVGVAPLDGAIPSPDRRRHVHIQRGNAPPELGGATATNNQAFCSTLHGETRPTMIELLSVKQPYATFGHYVHAVRDDAERQVREEVPPLVRM